LAPAPAAAAKAGSTPAAGKAARVAVVRLDSVQHPQRRRMNVRYTSSVISFLFRDAHRMF
jgi:hypothetical protein